MADLYWYRLYIRLSRGHAVLKTKGIVKREWKFDKDIPDAQDTVITAAKAQVAEFEEKYGKNLAISDINITIIEQSEDEVVKEEQKLQKKLKRYQDSLEPQPFNNGVKNGRVIRDAKGL